MWRREWKNSHRIASNAVILFGKMRRKEWQVATRLLRHWVMRLMRKCVLNLAEHTRYSRTAGGRRRQQSCQRHSRLMCAVNYSIVAEFISQWGAAAVAAAPSPRIMSAAEAPGCKQQHAVSKHAHLSDSGFALFRKEKKNFARLSEWLSAYFPMKLNFFISSRCSPFHHRAASLWSKISPISIQSLRID